MYADDIVLFSESVKIYFINIAKLETCLLMLKKIAVFKNKDKIKCNEKRFIGNDVLEIINYM